MKRDDYALICLIACSALIWLGGCRTLSEPSGPPPKITFEDSKIDFGDISPNKLTTGKIKFTNTGQGVLKITKIAQCCSVVARLTGGKKKYAPGESGAVEVEFTSGAKPILFKRELVVHSNDRTNPEVKLTVQANIVLNVTCEPENLKLFLGEENAGCPKLKIWCLDDHPFSITGFKSTGDCMTADFDPSLKATEFVLEPKVNMQKLAPNLKGYVTIGLTHPDGNAAIVLFDVVPKYSVDPQVVLLLGPEPDKPITRSISIVNNYGKNFEIESVSSGSDSLDIKVLEKKKIDKGYRLNVEMTPRAAEGSGLLTGEFSVVINGGQELAIPFKVWYSNKR